ncbi:hypothetical protein CR513_16199, partial [Mucuna pruriens]
MISIFLDLLEDYMEVFINDFIGYVESFEAGLDNLSYVLRRCIDNNLILNFEGIVLGHLVLARGIEVDKAKVNIISSLSNTASVLKVRSFLGHAVFIGNLSRILVKSPCLYPSCYRRMWTLYLTNPTWTTKLGVSIRVDMRCIQLHTRSHPRTKSRQATTCYCLCISDHRSSPSQLYHYKKGVLEIIFALEKFRSYLIGSKIIVFSDHAVLKFLLKKPDAKP